VLGDVNKRQPVRRCCGEVALRCIVMCWRAWLGALGAPGVCLTPTCAIITAD
jgi:hypothetical protein